MPINHFPFSIPNVCTGFTWSITNEDELARLVSFVILGYYRHADAIINDRLPNQVTISRAAKTRAIDYLTTVIPDQKRYHRDGWIFQIISWIAARKNLADFIGKQPQPKPAFHGLDGLWVRVVPDTDLNNGVQLIICEDKATENPRATITSEVWPEFLDFESGKRDSELINELTAVLERHNNEQTDIILENILAREMKNYRVSITSQADNINKLQALFAGYESKVIGDISKRKAETLILEDIRAWMDQFAAKVRTHIDGIPTHV